MTQLESRLREVEKNTPPDLWDEAKNSIEEYRLKYKIASHVETEES